MIYKNASTTSVSPTQQTLLGIGDAEEGTGGLWLYYDTSSGKLELVITNSSTKLNAAGGAAQSALSNMYADNTWQWVGLKREGDVYTVCLLYTSDAADE